MPRRNAIAALLFAVLMSAVAARAEETHELARTEGHVRRAMLQEFAKRWQEREHDAPPPAAAPSAAPADAEDAVEFRWQRQEKDLAVLRMTRKTLERYREIYRRWQDDAVIPRSGERNPKRYLEKPGLRDALAAGDIIFSAIHADGSLRGVPVLSEIGDYILEALRAVDRVQSGSALDVLGFETDHFFRDRFGSSAMGPNASYQARRRHEAKIRLRIKGLERVATGRKDRLRVGFTVSDRINEGPLRGWRVEGGAEMHPFSEGEVRGFVGATRPWPVRGQRTP